MGVVGGGGGGAGVGGPGPPTPAHPRHLRAPTERRRGTGAATRAMVVPVSTFIFAWLAGIGWVMVWEQPALFFGCLGWAGGLR